MKCMPFFSTKTFFLHFSLLLLPALSQAGPSFTQKDITEVGWETLSSTVFTTLNVTPPPSYTR